jgi:cysteine-S-conjugate beta-lyase
VDFDEVPQRRGTASFKWDLYGDEVLPLWVADMDFASPPPVVAALKERAAAGVYGYAKVPDSLAATVCARLATRYGWHVDPAWFVWLPGVVPGLNMTCLAFAGEGDEVLTVTPAYPPFLETARARGRKLVAVDAERVGAGDGAIATLAAEAGSGAEPQARVDRWRLPLEALERAITPATRVLLFCHPHNPLGRVWRRDEVAAVIGFCRRHDLVLCSDEIHCDLLLDDLGHVPSAVVARDAMRDGAPRDADAGPSFAGTPRMVTLMSPSKTFNLPGLNFAFAIVPDESMRRRFRAAGEGLTAFPGCFAIAAAEAAYGEGWPWLAEALDYLRANRDLVERVVLAELPRVRVTHAEATYLAWLDVRGVGLDDPAAACVAGGVALSDGAAFGAPGYLRLNFACPRATLEEALRRLRTVLR